MFPVFLQLDIQPIGIYMIGNILYCIFVWLLLSLRLSLRPGVLDYEFYVQKHEKCR